MTAGRDAVPRSTVLRAGGPAPLRLALILLAACMVLLGVFFLAVGPSVPEIGWAVVYFAVVFWIWAAAGLLAWWRRPRNAMGALILAGALAVLVGGLGNTAVPALVAVSTVLATVALAVAVHLLHAFPSGRLRGALSVGVVWAAYGVAIVLHAPLYLLDPRTQPVLLSVAGWMQRIVAVGVAVATAFVLLGRLRAADPFHRRILLPLYLYGTLAVLLIPVIPVVVGATGLPMEVSGASQLALAAGLPVAFLLGVLTGGFSPTSEIDVLSGWLAQSDVERPAVAVALGRALGDSGLQVAYRAPERSVFVDESGGEVDTTRRAVRDWVEVRVGDRLVGAIGYDPRVVADRTSVERAGAVLAIAVDRERLTAEVLAANHELRTSRRRLVEAADAERSRIARDLHDGLQVQLVLLALEAQELAGRADVPEAAGVAAEQLRRRIDASAADLRRLVHDVLPAALVEHGLSAALEDLVDRIDLPASLTVDGVDDSMLPAAVRQTAYLVAAESLANAVKHASATRIEVGLHRDDQMLVVTVTDDGVGGARVAGGAGLPSLIDRVDALRGDLRIASSPGAGTRIRAELPCAS